MFVKASGAAFLEDPFQHKKYCLTDQKKTPTSHIKISEVRRKPEALLFGRKKGERSRASDLMRKINSRKQKPINCKQKEAYCTTEIKTNKRKQKHTMEPARKTEASKVPRSATSTRDVPGAGEGGGSPG